MSVPLPPGRAVPILAAALLCLTACSTTPNRGEENPAEPAPSEESAQAEAALETYRSAQEIYTDVLRGEREWDEALPELEQLSSDQALTSFTEDALAFEEAGVTFEGAPSTNPEVTGIDTEVEPAVATITDCWDDSAWQPVDAHGRPLEFDDEQPSRRVINAQVEQSTQGQGWVLTQMSPEEGRTC